MFQSLFKKPTPQEQVREWQRKLRGNMRQVERQVRDIEREEKNVRKSVKEAAKRNDIASAKILAKEIVRSRKAVSRLYENRAQINSVCLHLSESLAMARAVGHLQKSTEVMKLVNDLMKTSEIAATMKELSMEMMKAGVIDEMVGESMESALDTENLEEDSEAEVAKVLAEIAGEFANQLPSAAQGAPVEEAAEAMAVQYPTVLALQHVHMLALQYLIVSALQHLHAFDGCRKKRLPQKSRRLPWGKTPSCRSYGHA
eukprot:jgi/Mesvir1/6547/Mv16807-RA.1